MTHTSRSLPAAALPSTICCQSTVITPTEFARLAIQSPSPRAATGLAVSEVGLIGTGAVDAVRNTVGRWHHPDALMRSPGVVFENPGIQLVLRCLKRAEYPVGAELGPQLPVEPLDLPRRGRRPRLGQQMLDPVLAQDPVEQHLHRRLVEPAREHLPVIREDLPRQPITLQRQPQTLGDTPCVLPQHQERGHAEPRVIIDPGQCLRPAPVREHEPTDDVHLPQLHRPPTLPPLPLPIPRTPRRRIDQPETQQRPIRPRHRRHRLHADPPELIHQPPRPPRRMPAPQIHQRNLDHRRHLQRRRPRPMRPIRPPLETIGLIPGQPLMNRLTRHPETGGHTRHRLAILDDRENGLIPLL